MKENWLSFMRCIKGTAIMRKVDFLFVLEDCSYKAFGIVSLISFMVGLILAFVGAVQMQMFGVEIYVSSLVAISMTRIMGAIMAGIVMSGRTGASYAATLGTMQVNEEIDALKEVLPTETAVVDARFKPALKEATTGYKDEASAIRLTSYLPNHLVYETQNAQDGIAVFSEIYYPDGWQVSIDGQPAELARADYILRCLYVPAGKHTIEMRFDPQSLHVTEGIAYTALAILLAGVLVTVFVQRRKASSSSR